jgi:hypothetical protein
MRQPHQPNANPYVEKIVQAYLQTQMNDRQFEALVEETIAVAKADGGGGDTGAAYDKGFSDGYDSAMAEKGTS